MSENAMMCSGEKNKPTEYQDAYFQYQLDLLKEELGAIERIVARHDETMNNSKNWAIIVWAGSLSVLLTDRALSNYILFTVTIPLLFWLTTARTYYHQNAAIYRQRKITAYVNSDKLLESFRAKKFVDFDLLDPMGDRYSGTRDFQATVNYWKIMGYRNVSILFGGMILLSIAAWLIISIW